MNPLTIIPAKYQLLARAIALVLLFALGLTAGWKVKGAFDAQAIAEVLIEHANEVAAAAGRSLAAQLKVTRERDELAGKVAALAAADYENLRRSEHANDALRADVAAGTRVVRIAATCPDPGRAAGVPQAPAGGSVDPGAGAVVAPEVGQRVLDLRAGVIRVEGKLAACQRQLACRTGQGPCDP